MAYRLQSEEAMSEGLRRAGVQQLNRAIGELTEGLDSDPVKAVHAARKALKKERSLLRLGRGTLDARQRRRENRVLRGVARRLSGARDSEVAVKTLDQLADRYTGQVPENTFATLRERLERRRDAARLSLGSPATIQPALADLTAVRERAGDWRFHRHGWRAIGDGQLRGYRRGRRAFAVARARTTDENLHEWRKRTKDVWYQLRLLGPLAPNTIRGQAQEAHHLSDLLGDVHDLAGLRATLLSLDGQLPVDVEAVIGLIDHRRGQLQGEAFFVGQRLYAEPPKAFARRMHSYWKAWRAEGRAALAQRPVSLAEATRASAVP